MTGVAIEVDLHRMVPALDAFEGLARIDHALLLDTAGAVLESGARRRLGEEKAAPDGTPWADWSESHARTREDRHSLLVGEGDLLDSITRFVEGSTAQVGSPLVYAAIHQFGGDEVGMPVPARAYLGLSDTEASEIETAIGDLVEGLIP